jgi:hypothetical protein
MSPAEARLVTVAVWAFLLLFFGWRLGAFGGPERECQRARAFADRAGLPAEAVDAALVRRVVRRQRFVLAGVALGLVAPAVVPGDLALLYVGLALGAVADQLTTPAPPSGTPRVAHATSIRLGDYVPSWLFAVVTAAALTGPVLAVLHELAPRKAQNIAFDRLSGTAATGLTLAALGGLAVSVGLARLVVRRRQAVGSPTELAVDDALRAQAVRDALHLTAAISLAVAFVLALALAEPDVDGPLRRVAGLTPVVLLFGIFAVGTVHELTGGPRHWRRRLRAEPSPA